MPDRGAIPRLQQIFRLIAEGAGGIDLTEELNLELEGVRSFFLSSDDGCERGMVSRDGVAFRWVAPHTEWVRNVGLLDPLAEPAASGHQYLTDARGSVVVEVSIDEPMVD